MPKLTSVKNEDGATPLGRPRNKQEHLRAFSDRVNAAIENNTTIPPRHSGEMLYIVEQFDKRFGKKITLEAVRKWIQGMSLPSPENMECFAAILEVEADWLRNGRGSGMTMREQRARDAMADGAVNLVAGLVAMGGGVVAFPEPDDDRPTADMVHLYAIVKGANYPLHVRMGESVKGGIQFELPPRTKGLVIIGVVPRGGTHYDLYELEEDVIGDARRAGKNKMQIVLPEKKLKKIDGFTERL